MRHYHYKNENLRLNIPARDESEVKEILKTMNLDVNEFEFLGYSDNFEQYTKLSKGGGK